MIDGPLLYLAIALGLGVGGFAAWVYALTKLSEKPLRRDTNVEPFHIDNMSRKER